LKIAGFIDHGVRFIGERFEVHRSPCATTKPELRASCLVARHSYECGVGEVAGGAVAVGADEKPRDLGVKRWPSSPAGHAPVASRGKFRVVRRPRGTKRFVTDGEQCIQTPRYAGREPVLWVRFFGSYVPQPAKVRSFSDNPILFPVALPISRFLSFARPSSPFARQSGESHTRQR